MVSTLRPLDSKNVYGSVIDFSKQIGHAWNECNKVLVPENYKQINKIVMAGMGGSALGFKIIESVYGHDMAYPIVMVSDYNLPGWVDERTLVFCSSYSGSTEETLSNLDQALAKKAKIIVITSGGKLLEQAQANSLPVYKIDPVYNPSQQPRMAVGYSVVGELVLAAKAGLLSIDQKEIDTIVAAMEAVVTANKDEVDVKDNQAKQLAEKIKDKQVIFAAGGHLAGPGHTLKNQMNENAKHLSHRHDLPELNHHLMEGLRFPESNSQSVLFWFISSNLYSDRLKRRLQLTEEVVSKNNIINFTWTASAPTKLSQAFELIQFGAFVNFYLSQTHGIDPAPIPWVDYFKSNL